ncbi:hotdog fold thioesterase [Arsenicicoccus dermatophilus]|uniref:hotdog fold thioesterase n=1 Tax=Arsenicicoccus dermatophilus TaxID=1076331 RepID=UPI001F4C7C3A|nr:hotdog fold thioesterase [Arsenicicoccus dermatophilus]
MLDPKLAHVRTMWDDDGASRHLGIELVEVHHEDGLGRARTRMAVTETMVNGHDIMHGGLIFTLADSTFALACNAGGQTTVAAGFDIDFVAPARRGDILLGHAVERARYGRNGIDRRHHHP